MKFLSFAAAALCLTFASCSVKITKVAGEPVRAGMTDKELLAEFGAPLEINHNADGSQDWTYRFAATESALGSKPIGWEEDRYGAGEGATKSIWFEKSQIHLSPQMKVSGEIPEGKVVRR